MHIGFFLVGIDQGEEDLVGHLIQNAGDAQHQDGPRVGEHLLEQSAVELPMDAEQVGQEEDGDKARAEQVDEEDVEHGCLSQQYKVDDVQSDVQDDEQHLERREAYGPFLKSQVTEG